jgi:hypothetical protein
MSNKRLPTEDLIESERKGFLRETTITPKQIVISRSTRTFKKKLTEVKEEPENQKDVLNINTLYKPNQNISKSSQSSFKSSQSSQSNKGQIIIQENDSENEESHTDNAVFQESEQSFKDNIVIETKKESVPVIAKETTPVESQSLSAFQKYINNVNKHIVNKQPVKKTWFKKLANGFKYIHKSVPYSIITTIILLVDLFHEDILVVFLPKSCDYPFEVLAAFVNCFFAFEMFLCFIFMRSYRFSAFNLIDVLNIFSLLPTLDIFYVDSNNHDEYTYYNGSDFLNGFLLNSHISKTSRASVKGSKLSRLVSFIRVLRVFSIGRIYKYNLEKFIKKNEERIIAKKQKEIIKLLRRKPIMYSDLDQRKRFFKRVHHVLNNPLNKINRYNMRDSQINPLIIKNFYQYAMDNEKKNTLKMTEETNAVNTSDNNILTLRDNHKSFDDTCINNNSRPHHMFQINNNNIDVRRRNTSHPKSIKSLTMGVKSENVSELKEDPSTDDKYICECEGIDSPVMTTKMHNNKRFSLISRDILAKINRGEGIDEKLKNKRSSITHLLPENFQKFMRRPKLGNILGSQKTLSSFMESDISNYCERCGGFMRPDNKFDETIQTYVNSRRESSSSEAYLGSNSRTQVNGADISSTPEHRPITKTSHSFQAEGNSIFQLSVDFNKKEDVKESNSALDFLRYVNVAEDRKITNSLNQSAFHFLNKLSPPKKPLDKRKPQKRRSLKRKKSVIDYTLRFFNENQESIANEKTHPRLSLKLSKLTTVRTVLMILFLLFTVQFFDPDAYADAPIAYPLTLNLMTDFIATGQIDMFKKVLNNTILNEDFRIQNDFDVIEFGFIDNKTIDFYNLHEHFHEAILYENHILHSNRASDNMRIDSDICFIIFSFNDSNKIQSILNINKILFITLMLMIWTFLITNDINELVVIPLENMFNIIKDKQIQPENLYYDINKIAEDDLKKLFQTYQEIFVIDDYFRAMGFSIIKVLGVRPYNYFRSRIFVEETQKGGAFYRLKGIIMVIYINDFNSLCDKYGERFNLLVSSILDIIDLTAFEHFGEILKVDGNKILVFWDEDNFDSTEEDPNADSFSSYESI